MTLAQSLSRDGGRAGPGRRLLCVALLWLLLAAASTAWAVEWRMLPAPPQAAPASPAQAEFLQALLSGASSETSSITAGVRTRSLRLAGDDPVALAVGPEAARAALDAAPREPLLLALLSHQESQALPRTGPDARVAVLLREPSAADQLALIDALLPERRRLGVVVTADSAALLQALRRATEQDGRGWELQVETASDPLALGAALRNLLPRSDVLLVLPDAIGNSQPATLAVLRAAAAAGVPVIGPHEGFVRSGALAALVLAPARLAQQAQALGERLQGRRAGGQPLVEWAAPAAVRINPHVARSLDLRLPSDQALAERLGLPVQGS